MLSAVHAAAASQRVPLTLLLTREPPRTCAGGAGCTKGASMPLATISGCSRSPEMSACEPLMAWYTPASQASSTLFAAVWSGPATAAMRGQGSDAQASACVVRRLSRSRPAPGQ
jgi:hypothetical protein